MCESAIHEQRIENGNVASPPEFVRANTQIKQARVAFQRSAIVMAPASQIALPDVFRRVSALLTIIILASRMLFQHIHSDSTELLLSSDPNTAMAPFGSRPL